MCYSLFYLIKHLFSKHSESVSNIFYLLWSNFYQNWWKFIKSSVISITEPRTNLYSVILLKLKVLWHIINYYSFWEVSSYSWQIFDKYRPAWECMLSVETMSYVSLWINLINYPICIILHRCSENYNFKILIHFLKKVWNSRSDEAFSLIIRFKIMN